jgi:hypothetical protein
MGVVGVVAWLPHCVPLKHAARIVVHLLVKPSTASVLHGVFDGSDLEVDGKGYSEGF